MDEHIRERLAEFDGAMPFDVFMSLALYAPGLGYYARGDSQFGTTSNAKGRSDFITAPELSPFFGRTVGQQVGQLLAAVEAAGGQPCITEFGAGTGQLMLQILEQQTQWIRRPSANNSLKTVIVELSAALRSRQQQTLAPFASQVTWADALPDALSGVLIGNEVLDAMPCKLLRRVGGEWFERCVGWSAAVAAWEWLDRPTALRPPFEVVGDHDYLTEIHPQAEAFIATLASKMRTCAGVFIDYGLPESEYYHPQRDMGTLMCHRAHMSDADPLQDVGDKDITTHINFTGIAMAAQNAGLDIIGYTSQGRFLLNCGLLEALDGASLPQRAHAQKLLTEHEMGELFKVIVFCTPDLTPALVDAIGFAVGDRCHTL